MQGGALSIARMVTSAVSRATPPTPRSREVPRGRLRRKSPPAAIPGLRGPDDPIARASESLTHYIPTEVIAAYVAAAASIDDSSSRSFAGQWTLFATFLILTPVAVLAVYAERTRSTFGVLPKAPSNWPKLEMILATVSFLIWSFALIGTPFSEFSWYKPAVGAVVLIIGSLLIGLSAPLLSVLPPGEGLPGSATTPVASHDESDPPPAGYEFIFVLAGSLRSETGLKSSLKIARDLVSSALAQAEPDGRVHVRVKVGRGKFSTISWRDMLMESDPSLELSRESFEDQLSSPVSGPRSALLSAMTSDWSQEESIRRIIVVFAEGGESSADPSADDVEAISTCWNTQMPRVGRRLVLFTPEVWPWGQLSEVLSMTLLFPSEAGGGLERYELEEIWAIIHR